MNSAKIYIVRHGETDMNRSECLQGHINCELNDKGIREANASKALFDAAGIRFDKCFCSPLKRARQTADIISGDTEVLEEPLITEMHFGSYEGMPYKQIDKPMWDYLHFPESFSQPEGVESAQSLLKRTGDFISRLLESDINGNILVVTHGIALRSILRNVFPESEKSSVWTMPIENCIVYEISCENGHITTVRRAEELSKKSSTDTSSAF